MTDPWSPTLSGEEHITTATSARMYDYWLGGKDNFTVDRERGDAVAEIAPWVIAGVRANREWLVETVGRLTRDGIDQFLDIGTGIPTSPNVHEVAQRINPDTRVVYVDNDLVVLSHARALLTEGGSSSFVKVLDGDLTQPGQILSALGRSGWLDLTRPVALLIVAVLHFVPDGHEAARIVEELAAPLAPGSRLVITQTSAEHDARGELTRRGADVYSEGGTPLRVRTMSEVEALFGGRELLPPGLQQLRHQGKPVTVAGGIAAIGEHI